jgi:colanic acid/amylovoran biosynthesis glycosyltransferase
MMRICITRTEKGRYSETFIQNQIDRLSQWTEVFAVHGGRLPQRSDDDKLLSPSFYWLLHNVVKTISGKRNNYFGNYGLKKFLKEKKIDAVLANYGIAGVHILPVCKSLGIPLVVHFHGFDATQQKVLHQYKDAYKILFRDAAGIVAVSADMKNKLVSLGAPEEKIALIPCGIDLKKFQPNYVKNEHALFLSVGRFIAKKSPQSTINAFVNVKQSEPEAKLVMIGQKSGLYEECKNIVQQHGIENDVLFTGVQRPDEIAKQMQSANVFVQHSVTAVNGDMEGTPNTVLEAAASGLPVVSTKHGGIKEAVIDGTTGFLADEHDITAMSAYMLQLIRQPGLAKEMGMAGRRHMEENYDLEKQAKKLFNVLKDAVNKSV